jgi:hypothetical protein
MKIFVVDTGSLAAVYFTTTVEVTSSDRNAPHR